MVSEGNFNSIHGIASNNEFSVFNSHTKSAGRLNQLSNHFVDKIHQSVLVTKREESLILRNIDGIKVSGYDESYNMTHIL